MARLPQDDSSAGLLADTIDLRREQIEKAAERARSTVDAGQLADAASSLSELKRLSPNHAELAGLVDRLAGAAETEIRAELTAGRIDRAEWLLSRLGEFSDASAELAALTPLPQQAARIAGLLESGNYQEALVDLRQLSGFLSDAKWLTEVISKAEQAAAFHQELQSTPFRLADNAARTGAAKVAPRSRQFERTPARFRKEQTVAGVDAPALNRLPASERPATNFVQKWLLQVDGAGSTLLLTAPRVMLGARKADLALRGFSSASPATIERSGGDYLIDSGELIEVGNRKTKRKLLGADESLAFGRRCRVKFRLPNPASTSAVLELSGPQLERQDVRRVVLLDDALIAGPAKTSHVVASALETPCVVFHQDGEFFVRPGIAGQRGQRQVAQPIRHGESVEVAGARFTLTKL